MVLRLVLVSIVTGLGVSPPAETELAGWTYSVQTWLDARLAEWIAQGPRDENATATVPVAPAVEPDVAIVDDELMALDEMMGLLEVANEVAEEPAPSADTAPDFNREFAAMVEEMVASFAQQPAPAVASADEGVLQEDALNDEEIDGLVASAVEREPAGSTPALATALSEPLDLFDELYLGLTFELDQQVDGPIAPARVEAPEPDPAPPAASGRQLSKAVRLTREALFAWMNLLQSPAIVTITP